MSEESRFWMVMVEGKNTPECRHSTKDTARLEAERLCRKEQKKAYILQAIGVVELGQLPVVYKGLDAKEALCV